jgi:RNA polymerase sigma-70 factor (sigma-E family)
MPWVASQTGWAELPFRSRPRYAPHWIERALQWLLALSGGGDHRLTLATPAGPSAEDTGPPTITDLYHARRLAMVRLAVLLVDDLDTAEDVVQDAFTAVYRRHGATLADLGSASSYLHIAVVNAARSVLRRRHTVRRHAPQPQPPAPEVDERLLLREEHQQVIRALHQLTARQREVLVLRFWLNLSEIQIAETLSLSRGTVKSTASRALDKLERLVREQP